MTDILSLLSLDTKAHPFCTCILWPGKLRLENRSTVLHFPQPTHVGKLNLCHHNYYQKGDTFITQVSDPLTTIPFPDMKPSHGSHLRVKVKVLTIALQIPVI